MTQAQAYVEHPYHWPVIGWMQDVQGLTLDDALKYHAVYYSPQNAIVGRGGRFRCRQGDQADHRISSVRSRTAPSRRLSIEIEPPQQGERRMMLRHAANLPAFTEAYHVPN